MTRARLLMVATMCFAVAAVLLSLLMKGLTA